MKKKIFSVNSEKQNHVYYKLNFESSIFNMNTRLHQIPLILMEFIEGLFPEGLKGLIKIFLKLV